MSARIFQARKATLADAFELINNNDNIVAAMAAAEPQSFFQKLGDFAHSRENLSVHCANPSRDFSCFVDETLAGKLELIVMFMTSAVRKHIGHGNVYYIPQHLSQWMRHLQARGPINVFWGSCTPPDERGFVSLGPGCCYESEALLAADKVILEVNPNLPMTFGSTHVPVDWVDAFIEVDHSLPTIAPAVPSETDRQIAQYVADLVENGSTLQLGIGGIPNAIGEALKNKVNLGVHTEMINDTMMDLHWQGVINGRDKSLWPGKMVGAFVYGSQDLYDFVNGNPMVELHPASIVNDPYRIGRNHRMVSINTAVEIDITGQVCSESVGHRELSGVGGASDTHIGAQRAPDGRGIVAIPSRTAKGESKICFALKPGAKVSISRNDIDTVVTEYGVAKLAGRSTGERVRALVGIAHPEVRDELLSQARKVSYL